MNDLSPQEVYDLTSLIFIENNLPEPRSIWILADIASNDLIDKGFKKNEWKTIVYVKQEGKELLSFTVAAETKDEYIKKIKFIIKNEIAL